MPQPHKQLNRNEKRIAELERLFIKIYEDNASGRLSDKRFDMLSQSIHIKYDGMGFIPLDELMKRAA